MGWLRNKVNVVKMEVVKSTCATVAFTFVMVVLLILAQEPNNYMTLSAVKSMYYKEAQLYHVIHLERESQLRGDEKDEVVRSCPIQPHLLFFDDITTDVEDWKNVSTAKWYKKKSVVVGNIE